MSNTIVRTNVMSLNSHRNLGLVGNQQSRASQRLSSGFRINSAADDAAGLGISEKMRSQIRGLDQASRNGQDGISLIQTAEGAMSTINEMVTRVRELVIQAANDTNAHDLSSEATWSQSDRTRIQAEINQLMDEIDATRNRVEFNTRRLIDGSLGGGGVGRALTGELRDLADLFINESDVAEQIQDLLDSREDVAATQRYLNEVLAFQTELINIRSFLGPDTDNFGGGLRNLLINAVSDVNALWASRVTAGLEPDVSNEAQRDFLANRIGDALRERMGPTNLTGEGNANADFQTLVDTLQATILGMDEDELGDEGGLASNANTIRAIVDWFEEEESEDIINAFAVFMTSESQLNIPEPPEFIGPTSQTAEGFDRPTDFDSLDDLINDDISEEIGLIGDDLDQLAQDIADLLEAINDELFDEDADWGPLAERFGDFDSLLAAWNRTGDTDGTPLWFQIGANANQGVHLSIEDVGVYSLSRVGTESGAVTEAIREALNREGTNLTLDGLTVEQFARQFTFEALRSRMDPEDIDTSTAYGATGGVLRASGEEINLFVTAIDLALSHVTDQRSNLGAMQNRLEFTIENLDIASENLSAAESRIRDADMAREMMRLTQANVLQQAAISMLAQANQAPQSVLQLLG